MGKKTQPKGRNPRKPIRRPAAGSAQSVSNAEAGDDASQGPAEAAACNHYSKGGDELRRVLLKIMSSSSGSVGSCEHCREAPVSKRGNKEKGKQQKKGGTKSSAAKPESNPIWVCLDCSHYACGGAVKDTEPYGHARRHAKQESHHWAVRLDDPSICWCFPCNSLVPIELPELANGDAKSAKNVVDGFVGGSAGQGKGIDVRGHQSPESLKGHTIRGLVNLGNTCFFNSVMQNLFAMDTLRNYFAATERPLGPLAMALKKLFVETSGTADSRGSLSPKALFGSICAKAPQFRGFQQQDSHELLRYLLDGLHTEETSSRKGSSDEKDKSSSNQGSTFVESIFGGQLSSTVSCMDCGHKSVVHEPFLDLSLPLPSKKSPAKKVPPPPPKRSKPPAKEKGRGRRFREKGNAKVTIAKEHHTVENANTRSECPEHCLPASEPKPVVAAEVEEDSFSWMDYLDPCAMPNSGDLVSQTCEIQNHGVEAADESSFVDCGGTGIPTDTADSVPQKCESEHAASKVNDDYVKSDCAKPSLMQDGAASVSKDTGTPVSHCSVGEQISQNEPDVHHTLNSNTEGSAEEPIVSNSCREVSCGDDIPSCTQDSSVTLLPHNEVDSTTEVINGATSCSQLIGSSVRTSSAGCEQQTDADFDGFGDLFNEPEAMSESREGAAMAEETDTAMWAGNFSESNQDEVDNVNAPVSIDSCLALFTKPELLLSDEHGWECERCSEILSHHNTGHKRDEIRRKKNDAGRNGIITKSASANSDVDLADSAAPSILSNMKTEAMSAKLGAHDEKHEFLNEQMDTSHESLDLVGGSYGMRHESADDCFEGNKLLDHAGSNGTQCTDLMHKDDNSQYMDHAPVCEKGRLLSSSGNQKNSGYSTNDSTSVQRIGQALALASISSSENSEVEKGNFSELSQIEKRSSKLVDVNPSNDDKAVKKNPKGKMVKRDASKRILVNKVPPILTVHLKRFAQDARGRLNKLRGHVCFQETLDLSPYMDPRCENKENCWYRLVGLVEHSGSMSGGHYVAYVRGDKSRGGGQKSDNSAWFYASDSHVRETSLSEVLQSEAYILFYERV